MVLDALILFIAPVLGGLAVFLFPKIKETAFKLLLVFAGAYLFSITIVHILPELFMQQRGLHVGIAVLAGFFMQFLLEHFTSGVEHGHLHNAHGHSHHHISIPFLIIALSLHAFLEGTLLAHPSNFHSEHGSGALLTGIVIHKIPAAFALMSILMSEMGKRGAAIALLIVFAAASPLGLGVSDYLHANSLLSSNTLLMLFALVSGNFLHISTTIFIESSPEHDFNAKKIVISLLGAAVAILGELMM